MTPQGPGQKGQSGAEADSADSKAGVASPWTLTGPLPRPLPHDQPEGQGKTPRPLPGVHLCSAARKAWHSPDGGPVKGMRNLGWEESSAQVGSQLQASTAPPVKWGGWHWTSRDWQVPQAFPKLPHSLSPSLGHPPLLPQTLPVSSPTDQAH